MTDLPEGIYRCKDPYTGPHNRCKHPTAPEPGYKRCKGGITWCPFVIPTVSPHSYCRKCKRDLEVMLSPATDVYQNMMEG